MVYTDVHIVQGPVSASVVTAAVFTAAGRRSHEAGKLVGV